MYTIEWALDFNGFTQDDPLNLHDFVLFYDQIIAEKTFVYRTANKQLPLFSVETHKNQLPHLIALSHWHNLSVRQPEKQYHLLLDGSWNLETLKKADIQAFQEYRARIEALPYLYTFLFQCKCDVKLINSDMPSVFSRRKMNMIFQRQGYKLAYILELREKRLSPHIYIPASFSVYNKNARALLFKSIHLKIKGIEVK